MHRIIRSSVANPTVPYIFISSHKLHDFREMFIERKMCVMTLSTMFVCNISHSTNNQWDTVVNVLMSTTSEVPVILVISWQNLKFLDRVSRNIKQIEFQENSSCARRVVPCGRTGGRIDRHDESNSRFWKFWESA